MSSEFGASNPYISTTFAGHAPPQRERAPGSLLAPAMVMIAVAGLGLVFSGFNFAVSFGEAHVDPTAPELVREMQRGSVGPVATAIQGTFVLLNLFIMACSVQMMKLQSWGLAVTGAVLSILNIGSCCCVLGLPVGIWSLSVLMSPDIISMFTANQAQQSS